MGEMGGNALRADGLGARPTRPWTDNVGPAPATLGSLAKMVTRYDARLVLRTVAVGSLLGLAILSIGMATDEPGSTWPGRLGRLASLLPIAGGLAAALVVAQVRARGEALALAAIGASPARVTRGAVVGGILVGLVGAAMVALGMADTSSLFPRIELHGAWQFVEGAWLDSSRALSVSPSGELDRLSHLAPPSLKAEPLLDGATALALLLFSLVVPAWATAPSPLLRRLLVALVVGFVSVASFHAVGAGRLVPSMLSAAPMLLLIDAYLLERKRSRGQNPRP